MSHTEDEFLFTISCRLAGDGISNTEKYDMTGVIYIRSEVSLTYSSQWPVSQYSLYSFPYKEMIHFYKYCPPIIKNVMYKPVGSHDRLKKKERV